MTPEALVLPISLTLSSVFRASALPKLRDSRRFVVTVLDYSVLPPRHSQLYTALS